MSIASEILRLQNAKAAIKASIENKGVTVPRSEKLDGYSSWIDAIPTATVLPTDVLFYDYDGSIVYRYTAEDFLVLSAMPANPTHEGLVAEGWNWSLADAQAFVRDAGKLDIGQMYNTTDGATRFHITLIDGLLEPYVYLAINGTATINWGDGNSEEITGTSETANISAHHQYATAGNYIISISSNVNFAFNRNYGPIGDATVNGYSGRAYSSGVTKLNIGSHVTRLAGGWTLDALEAITFPEGKIDFYPSGSSITSQGSCFYTHYLKHITLPNGVDDCLFAVENNLESISYPNTMKNIRFDSNAFLERIIIPQSVTGTVTITNCYDLKEIVLSSTCTCRIANIKNCWDLKSFKAKASTRIDSSNLYFEGCHTLSELVLPASGGTRLTSCENCYDLKTITIPSNYTHVMNFKYSGLQHITFPATVTTLGQGLFTGCYELETVEFASNSAITTIPQSCFSGCYKLTSLELPASITTINTYAFTSCSHLQTISFKNHSQIPTLSNINAFSDVYSDYKIIVPDSLYDTWIAASTWSSIASHIISVSDYEAL